MENELTFARDSNCLLVGPPKSGKTHLLQHILQDAIFIPEQPQKIYVLAPSESITASDGETQAWNATDIRGIPVQHIDGLPAILNFLEQTNDIAENSVVIFDDLGDSLDVNKAFQHALTRFFSVVTHHRHLWTFFVGHDLFTPGMTGIRRKTQNYIMFDVMNDMSAVNQFVNR